MSLGPAEAIPKCHQRAGRKFEDTNFGESHEAFTAPWFCVGRVLKEDIRIIADLGKVNYNVSGIALGQPVDNPGP